MVSSILVPVSPSGTGKTLRASISGALFSNQLVAALVLMVVSAYLISAKKPARITLYPAAFMLVTTLAALILQAAAFIKERNILLLFFSVLLFVLALFMIREVIVWRKRLLSRSTAAAL